MIFIKIFYTMFIFLLLTILFFFGSYFAIYLYEDNHKATAAFVFGFWLIFCLSGFAGAIYKFWFTGWLG